MRRLIPVFLSVALCACTSVVVQRGYVPDPEAVGSVTVGTDTKITVAQKLGNPSTMATFGSDVWSMTASALSLLSSI